MLQALLVSMLVSAAPPKWLPANFSFVPPLSVNAYYQFDTVNAFSLDALVGYSAGLEGLELSGIGSINGETRGAAIAGVFNVSGEITRGVQISGVVNVAQDVTGVQLSTVNVARNVTGVQLGVVNVADDADVTLGVVNWVSKGTHNVSAAASEFGSVIEADTGGRVVYGILAAGAAFRFRAQPQRYLLGAGIGWRAVTTDRVTLDLQAIAFQLGDTGSWTNRGLHTARAVASLRVAGPVSVFAGPTFNVLVDGQPQKIDPVGWGWSAGSDVRMWPGFVAGVRVF